MAQQFKMAPENTCLCEIKATVTPQLNVTQILFSAQFLWIIFN